MGESSFIASEFYGEGSLRGKAENRVPGGAQVDYH